MSEKLYKASDVIGVLLNVCSADDYLKATVWLSSIPSAVVRCKDCRHRDPEDHKCDSGETERQGCPFKVADDYFCAYGER